ncbi:hypothetical protein WJX73_009290 [Symbiochloris irregularis]|uniref:FMN hydroxy acid dehydrogenase domain-containing protein n=1 Tax=Symbiochloris irregularis TaxID=706552 RepID=A0AAW1PEB1_9CHLO
MTDQHWVNLDELEALAMKKLPKMVWGYYSSGSESEATLRDNRAAFLRYNIMPRLMVDVSKVDTTLTLFGEKLDFPLLIAPMAYHKLANPEGEVATARAAAACRIPMIQSTMATVRKEEVAQAAKGAPFLMLQLYVTKNRDFCRNLIMGAQKAGYKAIAVTVDAPRLGHREADERDSFHLPEGMAPVELDSLVSAEEHARQATGDEPKSAVARVFYNQMDSALTWDFVAWVRAFSSMRILVKGILSPFDALRAVEVGVDGIIVSNHGGRQLDFAPATLDCVANIKRAIGDTVPLLMDGGVRRGTDILKALALGADAVCVGRPILHGLAVNGQQGVQDVIKMMRRDFEQAMRLSGCPSLKSITRDKLLKQGEPLSRL